jgi:galactose mutarotase-like enzyme
MASHAVEGQAMDQHEIAAAGVAARVSAQGAELQSLRDSAGREFLWQAGPAWPRHAPVLFPIVGRLANDTLRHRGQTFRLTQHGFARDRRFEWVERTPTSCRLRLVDDDDTRAKYPFPFQFEVAYAVEADTLAVSFTIVNTGSETLPASMGAHPAFCWPLTEGAAKSDHILEFSAAEPAPIRRLAGGLMLADAVASPISGHTLCLDESLFAADAIVLDRLASDSVRFAVPGAPGLEMSWQGFSQLGIWMKPGADFLCIEPWCGYASPQSFDGEFADKPGLLLIPPSERRQAVHRVRLGA